MINEMEAIKTSVTDQFMDILKKAVENAPDSETAIIDMGRNYVSFFLQKPDYFKFLFESQNIVAHIYPDKIHKEDYPPFKLLKETYLKYLKDKSIKKNKHEQELDILKIWASAHGLAAIACMSGVETSFDWKDALSNDTLLR